MSELLNGYQSIPVGCFLEQTCVNAVYLLSAWIDTCFSLIVSEKIPKLLYSSALPFIYCISVGVDTVTLMS